MEYSSLNVERKKKGKIYYFFLQDILKSIDDVKYAIVKGEALSILEYGKCGCRDYTDIDILIERKNVNYLVNSLEQNGFKPIDKNRCKKIFYNLYSHQTIPYYKQINNYPIYVDINYDILWGEYDGDKIDIGDFLNENVCEEIYGKRVKVLSPLKAFVQLVLHTYKDMNSLFLLYINAGYKLKGLWDVYLILKKQQQELSVQRVKNICIKYKILPYAYYVLYYTYYLYKSEWLIEYVQALECKEGLELLSYFGLKQEERMKWDCDFFARFNIKDFKYIIKSKYPEKIGINEMVCKYEK